MTFAAQTSIAAAMTAGFEGMLAKMGDLHIGHFLNASRQIVTVTPTATNAATYNVTITMADGTAYTTTDYTADGSATVAEITAGLVALINATAVPVTAADATTTYTLTADNLGDAGGFTVTFGGTGTQAQATTIGQNISTAVGKLVVYDYTMGDDHCARVPRASADITVAGMVAGVVLADPVAYRYTNQTAVALPGGEVGACLKKGHVFVKAEQTCTPGQQAYVRYAAGGYGLGSFGNSAGSSERAALAGSAYRTSTTAGGLAIVELNIIA